MHRVLGPLALVRLTASAFAAETPAPTWPLWNSQESIEHYAKRANLPPAKTLDLGNGVHFDLVLIPAGKFTMGTPEPKPMDEDGFRKKIIVGQAVCAVGVGVLLVLVAVVLIRAVRQRRRPQYSLAMFMVMIVAAGVAVLGGMHWWCSTQALAEVQAKCEAAFVRYQSSPDDEKPAHEVTLTTPFYIGKQQVTQAQYEQVMGANPSQFKAVSLPVDAVSWSDAQEFCKKLGEKTGLTVQLPTESQWEFACRAGTTTTYYSGDAEADLGRAAWYSANSKNTTHPVGHKEPNAWGVYDMHGNVWEWCRDWHEQYKPEATVDPQGPPKGDGRVLRGGSWDGSPGRCQSASRRRGIPDFRIRIVGFRVVAWAPRTP